MDRRNFNKNLNYTRNNINNKRNDNGSDNSQKEVIKEHDDEFKEVFVIDKDPDNSYTILERQYFDAPNEKLKSHIICDTSYLS